MKTKLPNLTFSMVMREIPLLSFKAFTLLSLLSCATSSWSCENIEPEARLSLLYETMISGTLEDQTAAAAEFQTSLRYELTDLDELNIQDVVTHAATLADAIRRNQLPAPDQMPVHKQSLLGLNFALSQSGCDPTVFFAEKPEVTTSTGRDLVAIALSIFALSAFLYIVRPRFLSLKRWIKRRAVRQDIQIVLEVKFEDESGNAKQSRIRGIDLSTGGIQLLWPDGAPEPGTSIIISFPDLEVEATVVWSDVFNAGAAFNEPMDQDQVADIFLKSLKSQILRN